MNIALEKVECPGCTGYNYRSQESCSRCKGTGHAGYLISQDLKIIKNISNDLGVIQYIEYILAILTGEKK